MEVTRIERKYILNSLEAAWLKSRLSAVMPTDVHCASPDGYEVRSLYFDTISDSACAEKEDGLRIHEKLRARIYGTDDAVIKLENKRKDGEHQIKRSMRIDRELLRELCLGDYRGLLQSESPMAALFYEKLVCGRFPRVIIQYRRFSYCVPTNNIRITFDSQIRATQSHTDLFREPLLATPVLPQDVVILEVKYDRFLLGYIKETLAGLRQSPTSYSKYYGSRSFSRYLI